MSKNAMTEEYEHIELFGKPVLFTNDRVDRETVPRGWYRYDIRGSDSDPGSFGTLEREVTVNHAGTILSPEEIPFPKGKDYKPIRGSQNFLGEDMTLAEFCACHGLPIPESPQKYLVRPASPEEAGLFYAQTPEEDEALGAIGHVRIDFGHGGREFWHTWHPRGPEELNTPEFKAELNEVVGQLRESVLQDLSSMRGYCYHHGGEIEGGICTQNYGYTVETERYRYLLRCNPIEGDYQAYLSCFDKQAQEMDQAHGEDKEPIAIDSFAALKRAIKPGTELMATYHANHPEIVGLIRVVTEVQSNAFYSVIKGQPEHKFSTCNYGKGFRSDFEKASGYQFDGKTIKVLNARKGDGSVLYEFEVYRQTQALAQKAPVIGRVSFASGEQLEYTDPAEYLKTIREELPYHATSGFRFETLTVDPEVCKAADDALYDLYGEENPRKLEAYQEQPDAGMTMGGM